VNNFFESQVAPAISEIKVPTTADNWQLYASLEGAPEAAFRLSALLREKLTQARLVEECNLTVAARIRDEMYAEMARFSKLGATDTEPECVLVAAIEKALGLERETLSR
jgi:hypothetical protein